MWMSSLAWRTLGQRTWALWLAVQGVAGAWHFSGVPPEVLRRDWFSTVAWLFTLASCGVAAEAFWNGRGYRHRAALAVLWGPLLIWGKVIFTQAADIPRGVPLMVLVPLTVTSFVLVVTPPKHP
ncbi:MAG TPA: hypothetical protein VGB15_13635 [Longimicrobium sp.]|jgi:hypothetical protein